MQAADKKHELRETTQDTWIGEHRQVNSRPHAPTIRQNMERECPNPDMKPKLKTWVPGPKHHVPTQNKARKRESTRLKHTRSRALTWKQDKRGESGLGHKTMNKLDRSDRTLTLLWKAGEETITIIHPAGDKGMNKFLQSSTGLQCRGFERVPNCTGTSTA